MSKLLRLDLRHNSKVEAGSLARRLRYTSWTRTESVSDSSRSFISRDETRGAVSPHSHCIGACLRERADSAVEVEDTYGSGRRGGRVSRAAKCGAARGRSPARRTSTRRAPLHIGELSPQRRRRRSPRPHLCTAAPYTVHLHEKASEFEIFRSFLQLSNLNIYNRISGPALEYSN